MIDVESIKSPAGKEVVYTVCVCVSQCSVLLCVGMATVL